jgi:hypothetical protein
MTDRVRSVTRRVATPQAPPPPVDTRLWLAIGLVVLGVVGVVAGLASRQARTASPVLVFSAPTEQQKTRTASLDGRLHSIFIDPGVGEGFSMMDIVSQGTEQVPMVCTFFDEDLKVRSTSVVDRGQPFRAVDAKWARRWLPDAPGVAAGVRPTLLVSVPRERRASFEGLDPATTYELVVAGDATVLLALGRTTLLDRPTRFLDQPQAGWVSVVAGNGTHRFSGAQALWVTIISPTAIGTSATSLVSLSVAAPTTTPVVAPTAPLTGALDAGLAPAPPVEQASNRPDAGPRVAPAGPRPKLKPSQVVITDVLTDEEVADVLTRARSLNIDQKTDEAATTLGTCSFAARASANLVLDCYRQLSVVRTKLWHRSHSNGDRLAAKSALERFLELAPPNDPDVVRARRALDNQR